MKKRILGIILAAVMVVSYMPMVSFAGGNIASGTCGTCDWVIDANGTLTISAGTMDDWEYDLPWYDYKDKIKAVKTSGTVKLMTGNSMFSSCANLESLDMSGFDTANVRDMSCMFQSCNNLKDLDLGSFNTGNVTSMDCMFNDCSSLTALDLSGFDTRKVDTMQGMFMSCESLTSVDVSKFVTSGVQDTSFMFAACSSLTTVDVSNFDTGNVSQLTSMFLNCSSLTTIDVSSFDTVNVVDMGNMFYGCKKLKTLDLSSFNTGKTSSMSKMLEGCESLTTLKTGKNFNKIISHKDYCAAFPVNMYDIESEEHFTKGEAVPSANCRTYSISTGKRRFKKYQTKDSYLYQQGFYDSTTGDLRTLMKKYMDEDASSPVPGIITSTYDAGNGISTSQKYIPQGLCKFKDYYVTTSYYQTAGKKPSLLYVLDSSWDLVATVTIGTYSYHNGGIAYDEDGDVLWLCGETGDDAKFDSVYSLKGELIRDEISKGNKTIHIADFSSNGPIKINNSSSCLDYYDGRLWVGTWNKSAGRIIGYKTSGTGLDRGDMVNLGGVEKNLNGFTFAENGDLYCSYSSGRKKGNYSRITKYALLGDTDKPGLCIELKEVKTVDVPRMNEELMEEGSCLYVLYESCADKYINGFIKTDRITALPTELWGQSVNLKSPAAVKVAAESDAEIINEGESRTVSFTYTERDEYDTEEEFAFTPAETGSYLISISDISSEQDVFIDCEILDAENTYLGNTSTASYNGDGDEEDSDFTLSDSANLELNLIEGKTYRILSSVGTLDDPEQYSGSYVINISRRSDIKAAAVTADKETVETVSTGGSSCFRFSPDEDGRYTVDWSADGQLSDAVILEDMKDAVSFNGEYCDLKTGHTYYFISSLNEANGLDNTGQIRLRIGKIREDSLQDEKDFTGDTTFSYKVLSSGRYTASLNGSGAEDVELTIYDQDGNTIAVGQNDVVFSAEAGTDLDLDCRNVKGEVKLSVERYAPDINDLDITLSPDSYSYTGKAITPAVRVMESTYELQNGIDYTLSYENNTKPGTASVIITGTGEYKGKATRKFTINKASDSGSSDSPSAGTVLSCGGSSYKVTKQATKDTAGTVDFTKAGNKKSITVPSSITVDGKNYVVTQIGANAFKARKIRTVTIGKNVKKIGKNAFKGSAATKLIVKTGKLKKSTVKGSLKGSKVRTIQVKVGKKKDNKKYKKKYKKIFTKANAGKKVKIK